MSISKDGLSFEELTKLGENHCGVKWGVVFKSDDGSEFR
jgi:hypothetical protein